MGKKKSQKQKGYLEDGTEVEIVAMKAKVVHADGTEAEAWVTPEAPEAEQEQPDA